MNSRVSTGKRIRVLIVEPSNFWRAGLNCILAEDTEITCIAEAENGETALALVASLRPNMIISETKLPDMEGIALIQQAREIIPNIKSILMSNSENKADVFKALTKGIPGYCLKNVTDSRLKEIIKSVYEGAIWIDTLSSDAIISSCASGRSNILDVPALQSLQMTKRETEVLNLITAGQTNEEIAKSLYISVHTAKLHVSRVMDKLCVTDRVQAAVKATRACLVG